MSGRRSIGQEKNITHRSILKNPESKPTDPPKTVILPENAPSNQLLNPRKNKSHTTQIPTELPKHMNEHELEDTVQRILDSKLNDAIKRILDEKLEELDWAEAINNNSDRINKLEGGKTVEKIYKKWKELEQKTPIISDLEEAVKSIDNDNKVLYEYINNDKDEKRKLWNTIKNLSPDPIESFITRAELDLLYMSRSQCCETFLKKDDFSKLEAINMLLVSTEEKEKEIRQLKETIKELNEKLDKIGKKGKEKTKTATETDEETVESSILITEEPGKTPTNKKKENKRKVEDEKASNNQKNKNKNVVIFGLPESKNPCKTEKQKEEEESVNNLFQALASTDNPDIANQIEIKRVSLFRTKNNSNTITIVALDSEKQRNLILKNAKNLKNQNEYKNVFIGPDMTAEERKRMGELREQLKVKKMAEEDVNVFWTIRGGKLVRINKNQNRVEQQQDQQ